MIVAKKGIISNENDGKVLTIRVDGIANPIIIARADLTDDINENVYWHGLVQKISDAAAIPKTEMTGNPIVDNQTKYDAMMAVANRLLSGDWTKNKGDGSGPVSGIIFLAYAEFITNGFIAAGKPAPTMDQIRVEYDKKDHKTKIGLKSRPDLAPIIERIKSERTPAANIAETVDLLADFGI